MNDSQLQEKWAKALFDQNRPWLTAYILAQTGNMQDTEDLVQETFIRALSRLDDYDPSRPLGAWLRGFARNVLREYWRARGRRPLLADHEVMAQLEATAAASEKKWARPDIKGERLAAMARCLNELTDRARRVVELRYSKGLKSIAIARLLKMKEVAVNVMLMRARKSLQRCINRRLANELQ